MGQSSLLRLQEGRRPTVRRPFAAAAVRYRPYATAAFARTARDLHDGASPQLERLPGARPHQTRSRELAASQLQAVVRANINNFAYCNWVGDGVVVRGGIQRDVECPPLPAACSLAASWLPADLAASRLQAGMRAKSDSEWYARARDDAGRRAAALGRQAAWVAPYVARARAASQLRAVLLAKSDSAWYVRTRDAFFADGDGVAVLRLQAVARSKLVRNNYYPFVPDDRSPPSTRTSSLRRSHIPSPTSSAASAAPTASPGSPASPTLLPSPCSIFPSPPSPLPFDAASAATVLSTRARAALHQHFLRASQAAAATLTTRTRASLARIRDNNRRAALPGPRASVVNTTLTAAPSGSSAFCSPTTSAAFPRAQPLKSSSPPADQAAATTLSAFARAAPARTGYISQTAALPSCPRADNQASNFKFTAAPKDATASRLETTYAGPPRAAPPGTSCKPSLRPASKPFSPGILPTPLPQPRPGILPDPPLSNIIVVYMYWN